MLTLNYPMFLSCLRTLNSREEQLRLWNGPPESRMIGSFVETVCDLDGSGFMAILQNEPDSIHPEIVQAMVALNEAIGRVDYKQPELTLVESEQMARVRELAGQALTIIYRVGLDVAALDGRNRSDDAAIEL